MTGKYVSNAVTKLSAAYRAFDRPARGKVDVRKKPAQAKELLEAARQFQRDDYVNTDTQRLLDILV